MNEFTIRTTHTHDFDFAFWHFDFQILHLHLSNFWHIFDFAFWHFYAHNTQYKWHTHDSIFKFQLNFCLAFLFFCILPHDAEQHREAFFQVFARKQNLLNDFSNDHFSTTKHEANYVSPKHERWFCQNKLRMDNFKSFMIPMISFYA